MRRCVVSLICAVALWLLPAALTEAPNIVLVVVDTLRADRLGSYGNDRGLTPFLDQLAQRGTVFANAYAPSSWTCPSVASLFTSRYPSQHGVVSFEATLGDQEVTLAEQLAEGGYVAGGFSANFRLDGEHGYAQGFANWESYFPLPNDSPKPPGSILRRDGLAWVRTALAAWPERPTLLYLQYMEPHAPYDPPEPYRGRFGLPASAAADPQSANAKVTAMGLGYKNLSGPEVALLESLYDGEVAAVDAEIRLLFVALEETGFLQHAVIVITADHGEEFGEHGEFLHGSTLYNPSIRVPLIIIVPWASGGRAVTENVSLIDVAPTLIDLAGLPAVPSFEGHSLVPLVSSPDRPDHSQPRLTGDTASGEVISELERVGTGYDFRRHTRAIVDGSQKLLVAPSGETFLYDVRSDPGETAPLDSPSSVTRAADLLGRLEQIRSTAKERASASARRPLDDAAKEALRALGYRP